MSKLLTNKSILIFDMDGTLYQQDGDNGTFTNSSLFKKVMENSAKFVINRERCTKKRAEELVQKALVTDTIGISSFMADRYGITRAEFFDVVWNIDPAKILRGFNTQKKIIKKLKANDLRLFLLTGAPRIWMENVLNFLGIINLFERKYNGEMFGKKDEIFNKLVNEFDPKCLLSIGDQFDSDLKPAQDLKIAILEIKKPNDLLQLI